MSAAIEQYLKIAKKHTRAKARNDIENIGKLILQSPRKRQILANSGITSIVINYQPEENDEIFYDRKLTPTQPSDKQQALKVFEYFTQIINNPCQLVLTIPLIDAKHIYFNQSTASFQNKGEPVTLLHINQSIKIQKKLFENAIKDLKIINQNKSALLKIHAYERFIRLTTTHEFQPTCSIIIAAIRN